MLAHLQACEPLLIAFRTPDRLKLCASFPVDRQNTGVRAHQIGGGSYAIGQAESGRLHGLAVAMGGSQARKPPPCTELLALRGRHGLALHMVVEGEAPPGAQQSGTALE